MPNSPTSRLRPATPDDAPAISRVYDHWVRTSTVTFALDAPPSSYWADKVRDVQAHGWPFLVAVDDTEPGDAEPDEILGFAYVNTWRPRAAYRFTVEDTIYLAPEARGRGLGTALLAAVLDGARAAGLRQVVCVAADDESGASLALHRRLGFREIGRLDAVGFKFDRWLGTTVLQLDLAPGDGPPVSASR
ncbi:GNAT family N-acetyltransferase [Luteimicrobium subarcticum]|uniref:Phosphinothricin acetyltransferase n=1 Tax=Luteimicrobium subarcticum TaxID=620910 RepID=A0A2M8WJU0_9MICO|nr:GNAT family N-acetyltransferase [Luteimicrobium subarcticum]PJI91168.1 phosphinothricin acetyltransferase [Luteimicrobium subarcticum]